MPFGGAKSTIPGTCWGQPLHQNFQSSKVTICSWNVNGIRATIASGKLKEFLSSFDPDIVCFNETKADLDKVDKERIWEQMPSCYEQHWNCCKTKKGYSGVAIFTKVRPISVTHGLGVSKHDDEGRVLTLEFEQFNIVSCYTPNAGEGLRRIRYRAEEWDPAFFSYIQGLRTKTGKPVILGGDLNVAHEEIDIYDPKGKDKVPGYTPEER